MKAISVWQPWADLIRRELKRVETRSWSTNYRGDLLICSAKKKDKSSQEYHECTVIPILRDLYPLCPHFIDYNDLQFGKALCIASLRDCRLITPELIKRYSGNPNYKRNYEYDSLQAVCCFKGYQMAFGDWRPGRYAWIFDHVIPLENIFDVKGKRGLFDVCHAVLDHAVYSWFDRDSEQTITGIELYDKILTARKKGYLDKTFQIHFSGTLEECNRWLELRG